MTMLIIPSYQMMKMIRNKERTKVESKTKPLIKTKIMMTVHHPQSKTMLKPLPKMIAVAHPVQSFLR